VFSFAINSLLGVMANLPCGLATISFAFHFPGSLASHSSPGGAARVDLRVREFCQAEPGHDFVGSGTSFREAPAGGLSQTVSRAATKASGITSVSKPIPESRSRKWQSFLRNQKGHLAESARVENLTELCEHRYFHLGASFYLSET
jgi:hypothetical protein